MHLPLAEQLPGLRSYRVGRDVSAVRGDRELYLVAELEWDDIDALRAAFASEAGAATAADMANLTALAEVESVVYELAAP